MAGAMGGRQSQACAGAHVQDMCKADSSGAAGKRHGGDVHLPGHWARGHQLGRLLCEEPPREKRQQQWHGDNSLVSCGLQQF